MKPTKKTLTCRCGATSKPFQPGVGCDYIANVEVESGFYCLFLEAGESLYVCLSCRRKLDAVKAILVDVLGRKVAEWFSTTQLFTCPDLPAPEKPQKPEWETNPELYECEECSPKPGSPTLCNRCYSVRSDAGRNWKGLRP